MLKPRGNRVFNWSKIGKPSFAGFSRKELLWITLEHGCFFFFSLPLWNSSPTFSPPRVFSSSRFRSNFRPRNRQSMTRDDPPFLINLERSWNFSFVRKNRPVIIIRLDFPISRSRLKMEGEKSATRRISTVVATNCLFDSSVERIEGFRSWSNKITSNFRLLSPLFPGK